VAEHLSLLRCVHLRAQLKRDLVSALIIGMRDGHRHSSPSVSRCKHAQYQEVVPSRSWPPQTPSPRPSVQVQSRSLLITRFLLTERLIGATLVTVLARGLTWAVGFLRRNLIASLEGHPFSTAPANSRSGKTLKRRRFSHDLGQRGPNQQISTTCELRENSHEYLQASRASQAFGFVPPS
jgi:hypothetical protein